ncbi:MAG: hypothetical protein V9G24_16555 [Rhodoblastus sp.]
MALHDLIVLPRLTPTVAQTDLIVAYVEQGGKLLALLPDDQLLRRFGMQPRWRGIAGGYLHPVGTQPALAGLCTEPVQIIVPATAWTLSSPTTVLAEVRASADPAVAEGIPGVVYLPVGQGAVVLWAYDLAYAVARLRQGDPAHADLCFAGLDGIYRPSELFVGQLAVAQMLLPQADLQTALLARTIGTIGPAATPLVLPGSQPTQCHAHDQ